MQKTFKRVSLYLWSAFSFFLAEANAATIKIAVVSPGSGPLASVGGEVLHGAELAVKDQQAFFQSMGHKVVLVPFDDQASANKAVNIAKDIVNDSEMLGIIGGLNSSVTDNLAKGVAAAHLAIISPASTNDALTQKSWSHFSRVIAPDQAQAVAAAAYIDSELKAKKVFVISDNTAYGNGLSLTLQNQLRNLNIPIVGYIGARTDVEITAAIRKAKASGADLVYFGGTDDVGAKLIRGLRAAGVKASFMGGDGLDSPTFVNRAGEDGVNVIYTTGFGPIQSFSHGPAFALRYKKAYGAQPSGVAAYSYDAAYVLLQALRKSVKKAAPLPSRNTVAQAVRKISVNSCYGKSDCKNISGNIAFNGNGERSVAKVYVMKFNQSLRAEAQGVKVVNSHSLQQP